MTAQRPQQGITNYVPPQTQRPAVLSPEHDTIFGNTYNGVPNPMVPYQHPYPTRFHGPVYRYPQPGWQYERAPYAKSPFAGFGEPILGQWSSATGNEITDGLVGVALGFFSAPTMEERLTKGLIGGGVGMFFGYPGMIAYMFFETILAHRAAGRREDIGQLAAEFKSGVKRLTQRGEKK